MSKEVGNPISAGCCSCVSSWDRGHPGAGPEIGVPLDGESGVSREAPSKAAQGGTKASIPKKKASLTQVRARRNVQDISLRRN